MPERQLTFLLTDVEGSTRLWEERPDEVRGLLERHDALVATQTAAHHGALVQSRSEGDSAFVVFDDATDALACALELQRAFISVVSPGGIPLRVRMGLHSGTPELRGDQYYGPVVNRCAALRNIAHGGQVVLSEVATEQVRTLPDRAELVDRGLHRLKGVVQPERVFELRHADLPADFPPLRSLDAVRHNLSAAVSSFVGGDESVRTVTKLLFTQRVVTLAGAGGVGKTRLAVEVGRELVESFEHGVWLVELAGITSDEGVEAAVAAVLGLREQPGRPLLATLTDHLRDRELLVILDNCEHLHAGCHRVIETMIRSGPRVRALATSRHRLDVAGEHVWRVPSLTLPDPADTPDSIGTNDAVRLFLDRSGLTSTRRAQPAAAPSVDLLSVATICRRVDGIPLAIEMAAARAPALGIDGVLRGLDDRLGPALAGGEGRQETLRATIDWSHSLLEPLEQVLLHRLSVFAGGFTLEAAEGVAVDDLVTEDEVLDLLAQLVSKSLVQADDRGADLRYRLLESVRQYAGEQLELAGAQPATATRHQTWFNALAFAADAALYGGGDQRATLDLLDSESDNLLAALAWQAPGQLADERLWIGARLAARFWDLRGNWTEGRRLLESLLLLPTAYRHPRIVVLYSSGLLSLRLGDHEAARRRWEEALAMWLAIEAEFSAELRDTTGDADRAAVDAKIRGALANTVPLLQGLGELARQAGDLKGGRNLFERALALAKDLGDPDSEATLVESLAAIDHLEGRIATARDRYEVSLRRHRGERNDQMAALTLNNLGALAWLEGDYASARARYTEGLEIRERLGDRGGRAWCLVNLADLDLITGTGDPAGMGAQAREIFLDVGDKLGTAHASRMLGEVAWHEGALDRARSWLDESLRLAREMDSPAQVAATTLRLAQVERATGDLNRSDRTATAALATAQAAGDAGLALQGHIELALLCGLRRDLDRASSHLRTALQIVREIGAIRRIGELVEAATLVALLRHDHGLATAVLRAGNRLQVASGRPRARPDQDLHDRITREVTGTAPGQGSDPEEPEQAHRLEHVAGLVDRAARVNRP